MASIVGDKYKHADGSGWVVTDKIFGYMDKAGDIYNKVRYPQPGDPDYLEAEARLRAENAGMFGLPKPWGVVLLVSVVGLVGFGIYRIATK
jgi:hypothetical protein